jgi:hypothetical protein
LKKITDGSLIKGVQTYGKMFILVHNLDKLTDLTVDLISEKHGLVMALVKSQASQHGLLLTFTCSKADNKQY